MTPERWQQVSRIFQSAIELDTEARADYLEKECGSDQPLREEVSRLINSHQQASAENFIAEPAFAQSNSSSQETRSLVAGQLFGPYLIVAHLGTGGMGEVYLATDTRLDRRVALKILSGELAHDKRRMQRFEQEARLASSLNQPNILTIFEFGEVDSLRFLATEYVEGETLRRRIHRERLKLSQILDISAQVVAALDAAHEAKIVHRDMKPENIMIRSRDHIVKVLDFGLAKTTERTSVTHATDSQIATQYKTAAGTILGTVNYMSPEQAQGQPVDARTDIWSVGIIIQEMVTGEAPFKGRTPSHTIVQILENEPSTLTQNAKFEVPSELQRIVSKALTKQLDDRYQNTKDLLIDLRKLRKQLDVEVEMKRSVGPSSVAIPTSQTRALLTSSDEHLPARRTQKWKQLIGIVLGVIVGIGIVWGIRSYRKEGPTNVAQPQVAPTERKLTYSITVQKYRYDRPFEAPFQLSKEIAFERDYQIRLNINSPQPGFLYILNEGPQTPGKAAEFVVLFPSPTSNSGSALVTENHLTQIPEKSWIHFDNEKGTERVWLIFSANAVPELEQIRAFANPKTQGLITDAGIRDTVQSFLREHSRNKPTLEQNVERKETTLTVRGDLMVNFIDLEHQ